MDLRRSVKLRFEAHEDSPQSQTDKGYTSIMYQGNQLMGFIMYVVCPNEKIKTRRKHTHRFPQAENIVQFLFFFFLEFKFLPFFLPSDTINSGRLPKFQGGFRGVSLEC